MSPIYEIYGNNDSLMKDEEVPGLFEYYNENKQEYQGHTSDLGLFRVIKGVKLLNNKKYDHKENRNLIFTGKNISLGYFKNFEDIINHDDSFKGVLKTGDIGFIDEDNCITITGRESRFAKIDGHRIALDELEQKLTKESENFVIVSNDEFLFVALPNSNVLSQKKVINLISKDSTLHKSRIKVFDVQIPLTSNGKISYSELLKIMVAKIK